MKLNLNIAGIPKNLRSGTALLGFAVPWCSFLLPVSLAQAPTPDQTSSWHWAPYDETAELNQQADHQQPRMRFKLINSHILDKNSLWSPFEQGLSDFNESRYEALKPLILEQDIPTLQRAIGAGSFSHEELVKFYLYRIRLYESNNALSLNALIATNGEVIAEARQKDRERANGVAVEESSLFGMPILLKDNIAAAGMATTAGAVVLQQNQMSDAFITQRLKADGALILGKANLSEWAYYFCDGCPLGYSAMGGQTLNPYGRKTIETGGSSSGSAVAVAANYAVAAVGSETSGSILSPSSLNSVVGLKPTTGLLSRTGVVPISTTLDTTGPIARNMTDAVILFNAMTGYDESDRAMPLISADAELLLRDVSLKGKRLGYFQNLTSEALYGETIAALQAAGAQLIAVVLPDATLQGFGEFLGAEMEVDLAAFLAQFVTDTAVRSVSEIVEFNAQAPLINMPYGQGRFDAMLVTPHSPEQINTLRDQIRAFGNDVLAETLASNNLDALLSINNFHAAAAAAANFPALTLPMGYREDGTPAGITLITASFAEQDLIDIGYALERIRRVRQMPGNYQ